MFAKLARFYTTFFGIQRHPDGSTTLLGQRFHSVIAYLYFGLGWIMATTFARWYPEAADVRSAFGMIVFLGAWVWILWMRYRKPEPRAESGKNP
jgi:hypothetical protein